jgi:hypothetical protein
MKRLTVNDKILLNISQFDKLCNEIEIPYELTQDGLADSIGISRGHAAISVNDLMKKGFIEDRLAHIKNAPRQRKVYFLTQEGRYYSRRIRNTFYKRHIMFRDLEGNETEVKLRDIAYYFLPHLNRYVLPYEIMEHLSEDNIFNAKTFYEEQLIKEGIKISSETINGISAQSNPSDEAEVTSKNNKNVTEKNYDRKSTHPSVQPAPQPVPQHANPTPINNPVPYQYATPMHYPQPSMNPHYYQYYNPYYQYNSPNQYRIKTHEERKKDLHSEMLAFFLLGLFFTIIGSLGLIIGETDFCATFFVFFIIGSFIISIGFINGFKNIAYIGKKGHNILLGMGFFYLTMVIFSLETIFFNFPLYVEPNIIGLMLLIFLTALSIVVFAKQIKIEHRIEVAIIVGIFSILYGLFSFILYPRSIGPNPFIYAPFWMLFGAIILTIGYELRPKEGKEKDLVIFKKYLAISAGVFIVGITIGLLTKMDFNGSMVIIYSILGILWISIGIILISIRFLSIPFNNNMLASIKKSIPLGAGAFILLIGLLLIVLGKIGEGVIESLIGFVIIGYGFPKYPKPKSRIELFYGLGFLLLLLTVICISFICLTVELVQY